MTLITRMSVCFLLVASVAPLHASETKSNFEKVLLRTAYDDKSVLLNESAQFLRTHPRDVDVLAIRARTLLEIDRIAEARSCADRALALQPKLANALSTRGYCRITSKDFKGAIADYEVAVENQEPIYYVSMVQTDYANLATLYRLTRQKRLVAASAGMAKLEVLIRKAGDCRESGALDQAIKLLTAVLDEQPNFHSARLLRGVTYNNKGLCKLAINDFNCLIKAFPSSPWFYYLRSDAYSEIGDKARSLSDLLKIIELKPRIVAFNYTAQTGRVREQFEGKDENIVNLADIYALLYFKYADLGQMARAKAACDRCLALDANEVRIRLERAALLHKSGHNAAALHDLDMAVTARPKFVDAYLERAKLKEVMNDSSALNDFSKVVALGVKDPGSYLMRAEFYRRKKQYAEAIKDFDQALQLSPHDGDAFIGRGQVYENMSQWKAALDDYRKAVKLSPEDKVMLDAKIAKLVKLTANRGR